MVQDASEEAGAAILPDSQKKQAGWLHISRVQVRERMCLAGSARMRASHPVAEVRLAPQAAARAALWHSAP